MAFITSRGGSLLRCDGGFSTPLTKAMSTHFLFGSNGADKCYIATTISEPVITSQQTTSSTGYECR